MKMSCVTDEPDGVTVAVELVTADEGVIVLSNCDELVATFELAHDISIKQNTFTSIFLLGNIIHHFTQPKGQTKLQSPKSTSS